MGGNLLAGQRDALGAEALAERTHREAGAGARVDRDATAQIGEREGGGPVTAEGRADEREQRGVLGDQEELSVAEFPAPRGEVAGKQDDGRDEGLH